MGIDTRVQIPKVTAIDLYFAKLNLILPGRSRNSLSTCYVIRSHEHWTPIECCYLPFGLALDLGVGVDARDGGHGDLVVGGLRQPGPGEVGRRAGHSQLFQQLMSWREEFSSVYLIG